MPEQDQPVRDAALERMLAAMPELAPLQRRKRRPRLSAFLAALGVFALAGAGAGALTAGALVTSPGDQLLKAEMANFAAGTSGAKVVGDPVFQHGAGTVGLRLEAGGSSSVAIVEVWCLGAGEARWKLGDGEEGHLVCSRKRAEPEQQYLGAQRGPSLLSGRIEGDVAIWAGRVVGPEIAASSPFQKEAVADGVITRDEYVQAYSRMVGCLGQAGFAYGPLVGDQIFLPTGGSSQVITVLDRDCYPREFQDVDAIWQSEMQARIGPCLAKAGAVPSNDRSDWELQLQQDRLTPESCGLW